MAHGGACAQCARVVVRELLALVAQLLGVSAQLCGPLVRHLVGDQHVRDAGVDDFGDRVGELSHGGVGPFGLCGQHFARRTVRATRLLGRAGARRLGLGGCPYVFGQGKQGCVESVSRGSMAGWLICCGMT